MFVIDDEQSKRSVLFIDTSGSVIANQQPIKDFLSQLAKETKWLGHEDFELYVASFNSQILEVCYYTKDNIQYVKNYPIQGGGPAELSVCWKFMRQKHLDTCFILTDGVIPFGDKPEFSDITFIFHSNIKIHYPNYGKIECI